jgi:hypothetical protein
MTMDGFEPNGSDLTNEFINTVKSIINSSKSSGEKSDALSSLFQSMTGYLNGLDIDSRLKIVEQIILEEAEEIDEEKKELVQRVNEELQKMTNEYKRELEEKHQQEMLKEIEKSAKPEEKAKVDLAPDQEEINDLDELEEEVDNFLARNKDGFRYTIENQQDIERIKEFVKKFNESPDQKLSSASKKLSELRAQMTRLREKFSQFQDACDSINTKEKLSKLDEEHKRLEKELNSAPNKKSREELKKEIEINRLSREQVMIAQDVQQNLQERMRNVKAFRLNRDFQQKNEDTGPINESNFYSYEQEILKHCDVRDGEYVSMGWKGAYRFETVQLQTQNLFSTKSLMETLQKEIPKALDETNESYIARVNAMPPESMNITAKRILNLLNQVVEEATAGAKATAAEKSSLANTPTPQPPAPSSQSETKEQEKNQAKILPHQSTLSNNLQSLQHPNLQSSAQPESTSNKTQKNFEGPSTLESK